MWDRFGDCLRCLGHDRKNIWLKRLREHPLDSMNVCPIVFKGGTFLHWKLALKGQFGYHANNMLFFVLESSFFDLLVSQVSNTRWRATKGRQCFNCVRSNSLHLDGLG